MRSGLWAEFVSAEQVQKTLLALRRADFEQLEAYSPYPCASFDEALGVSISRIPWFVFAGATFGIVLAYAILYYTQVIDYPLNVGGRPQHAAIAYLPIVFETMVLGGALAAFGGFLWLSRLPHPRSAVMDCEGFENISCDRFAIAVAEQEVSSRRDEALAIFREHQARRICMFGDKT